MDLSVVERLICPEGHAVTPLVVRADEVAQGRLIRGVAGCPQCLRDWEIENGVARFGARANLEAAKDADAATIAALLGLAEPMYVLTDGASRECVETLSSEYSANIIAIDASGPLPSASVLDGAQRVPIAPGTVRAALLLRPDRDAAFVASATESVMAGGRMVGVAAIPLPAQMSEMARDERWWVAVREQAATPVTLRRRGT